MIRVFAFGRVIEPADWPHVSITPLELGKQLAVTRRWRGMGESVASHSVRVATTLRDHDASKELVLRGLLHDAHEAITGDVSSPVKGHIGRGFFTRLEQRCDATLAAALIRGGTRVPALWNLAYSDLLSEVDQACGDWELGLLQQGVTIESEFSAEDFAAFLEELTSGE